MTILSMTHVKPDLVTINPSSACHVVSTANPDIKRPLTQDAIVNPKQTYGTCEGYKATPRPANGTLGVYSLTSDIFPGRMFVCQPVHRPAHAESMEQCR